MTEPRGTKYRSEAAEPEALPRRDRILNAAVEEFGEKGYSGARTAGIARRAGVNQQLISYYFDGKAGLLQALRARWATEQAVLAPPGATFGEAFAAYLDATLDHPNWARLVVWRGLGDHPDDEDGDATEQPGRLRDAVERVERRQRDGEITDDVEPWFVLLLAYALAFAPIAMPQIVQEIFGEDPFSTKYRRECAAQLLALVAPAGAA